MSSKPSRWTIANYWLCTVEGRQRFPGNKALIDVGEPHCFGCGYWEGYWDAAGDDAESRWDAAAELDRAHIVPSALGGPDRPENLLLLCRECHRESPDHADPEMILRWLSGRSDWDPYREVERLRSDLAVLGVSGEHLREAMDLLGIGDVLKGNAIDVPVFRSALNMAFRRTVPHFGNGFSKATVAAVLADLASGVNGSADLVRAGVSAWAACLSHSLLARELPRRWAHSTGVSLRAIMVGGGLSSTDADLLASAAVLHDIGYAASVVDTGHHAIDGARFLRDTVRADDRIVRLVAHHSCAAMEAEERGLVAEMGEFEPAEPLLTDALIYCDMTTTPDGGVTTVDARIAEIKQRYGAEGPVGRFIVRAEGELTAATRRIEELLRAAEVSQSTTG